MDILAHVLWAYIIFPDNEYKTLALIFAVIPDVTSTIPFLFHLTLKGKLFEFLYERKGIVPRMPKHLIHAYKFLHSLPIILIFATIFYLLNAPLFLILAIFGSWFFHVLTDIFLHDKTYIKTPFLYPFSDYTFNRGLNWAKPIYLSTNYALIIIGLAIKVYFS